MKTLTEIQILEWKASRDRLLDAYIRETAETEYGSWFIRKVRRLTAEFRNLETGINLNCLNAVIVMATSDIIDEIVAMQRIADKMEHFLNSECDTLGIVFCPETWECTCDDEDEYDPYCEDVYDVDEI